ncbi:hypothetical protein SH449x_000187 [Pirellulaceae bacterium SH449]
MLTQQPRRKFFVLLAFMLSYLPQNAFAQKPNHVKLYEYAQGIMEEERRFNEAKKITLVPLPIAEAVPSQPERLDIDRLNTGLSGRLWPMQFTQLRGGAILFKVLSVPDDKNTILINRAGKVIWLEGYPTNELVDGDSVVILDYVKVVGTKQYRTVGGADSKVWAIQLLPKEETAKRLQADRAQQKLVVDPLDKETGFREWVQKDQKKTMGRFVEMKSANVYVQSKDGKITPIKFGTLVDSDKLLARKLQATKDAEKATQPIQESSKLGDSQESNSFPGKRQRWNNVSYRTYIFYTDERRWSNVDSETGKHLSYMEFRTQTPEYVELFNLDPLRKDLLRLYNDRLECKHGDKWVVIGSGNWDIPPDSSPVRTPTRTSSSDVSAEIKDVKIVTETSPTGKRIRVVKVAWKNTGTKPIRALDGNFFINDNTGTLPAKFEYSIFACSNLEPGVKPGEDFVLATGGFVLPEGCTADRAKVEITNVQEQSNFGN